MIRAGYALMALGVLGIGAMRTIPSLGWGTPATLGAIVIGGTGAVGIGWAGLQLSRKGRKLRTVATTAGGPAADGRRPVVYLRSFVDDEKVADAHIVQGFFQLRTEEEQLASVLDRIGPVVAIGDPTETLPDLGAARIYVGDGDWQARVLELLSDARLVVLRVSSTKGVRWELQQAVSRLPPERLVLLIPKGRRRYRAVKATCSEFLARPLPALSWRPTGLGSLQAIVRFDDAWTPEFLRWPSFHYVRTSLRAPFAHRFQYMLAPVFDGVGVEWRKPPVTAWGIAASAIGLAVIGAGVGAAIVG